MPGQDLGDRGSADVAGAPATHLRLPPTTVCRHGGQEFVKQLRCSLHPGVVHRPSLNLQPDRQPYATECPYNIESLSGSPIPDFKSSSHVRESLSSDAPYLRHVAGSLEM